MMNRSSRPTALNLLLLLLSAGLDQHSRLENDHINTSYLKKGGRGAAGRKTKTIVSQQPIPSASSRGRCFILDLTERRESSLQCLWSFELCSTHSACLHTFWKNFPHLTFCFYDSVCSRLTEDLKMSERGSERGSASSSVSSISAKTDRSKENPPVFSPEPRPSQTRITKVMRISKPQGGSASSSVSSISAKTDRSKENPPVFSPEPRPSQTRITKVMRISKPQGGSASSSVSSISAKTDRSKENPPVFSPEPRPSQTRITKVMRISKPQGGSASSTVSSISAKTDRSKENPPVFSPEPRPSQTRITKVMRISKPQGGSASSSVSSISAKTDRSKENPPVFSPEPRPSQTRITKVMRISKPQGGSASSSVSSISAKTDRSKENPPVFSPEPRPSQTRITKVMRISKPQGGSASSSVSSISAKTDRSKENPPVFSPEPRPSLRSSQAVSRIQQNQDTLKVFEYKAMAFVKQALTTHKKVLSTKHKGLFEEDEQEDTPDDQPVDFDDETNEAALKIALHILRTMNEDEHAHTLEQSHYGELAMYQKKQKSSLKSKNECILEAMTTEQWPVPLKNIYTKLYLIEGDSGEVNSEHEVRQIETAFNRQMSSETLINSKDIFKTVPKQKGKPNRTVLTQGIAGIGKTVLTQKFMLDWSEEKANQDIQLLFSLPFRELNLIKNERKSLMELLYVFSPDLKRSGITDLNMYKVLFVLDGLDECRLPLDFKGNERCCDATWSASVDVLLTNLIAGNLLPKANLWITTRPAAASCIPRRYVDLMTEIRGFNNTQKDQYFHKKIEDENLARRVIANIKSTRSLYIMCHVPVFCWISSIVLGKMCAKAGGGKMPKTLTQMYIHFLAHQTTLKHVKYCEEEQRESQGYNEVIMSLGKLAFQQLEKGNLIFYEGDLIDCGIDVKEASVYSGVCTQVFREEFCMQDKVFCFVHLSVQEFLAALYVHVMYMVSGVNVLIDEPEQMAPTEPVCELHKAAVDRALESDNGHLDLFLRFLLGLSMESSQGLLRGLKIQVKTCDSQSHEETVKYIKQKVNESLHPEKYINLFHCMNELNDHSLVEEIQSHLDLDRDVVMDGCSVSQWAALVFVLLTSPEKPKEIHLNKYSRTEEGLLRLLPAIKASRSAMLNDCNLTADCLEVLSSTLSSSSNELNHLNLSDNSLQGLGMEHLCTGLRSPHCRLKTLRLNRCSLTQTSCEKLASVLSCPSSDLRELDLSDNDVEDSGVQMLSGGLGDVRCKLEALRLAFCNITEKGCGFLASAVKSNPSHLSELDLSYNHLGDAGVKLISEAVEEGRCELTKLRVDHSAEHWFRPALRKYARELTVDPDTAHRLLVLSDGQRKVSQVSEEQPYPDHPDRFDYWAQVLFQQGLTGRCYWEVEWEGKWAGIGVTYKGISRKGPENDCVMGYNEISWSLHCSAKGYRAYHNFESIVPRVPLGGCRGLAVYLDWEAGILSFYRGSSGGSLTHLHTFLTKFTEPLYPILRVWGKGSSVQLRQVKQFASEETE
ncbi:NACHT, LRR and PYD domains-containing protein 5-like isoform X3 [Chelmon rostratus]|uniref:NACHT, LRR and PYD domains-containing protein 5-like isoform X3 n=1 Tax=Chelmon rostratus TaxID=109905 RepID=UPI001BE7DC23|nr:NACHT, LRR and PYD domains-containing protein 5-like isoform X3 [Chelmon rostratus]